jgi:hypothetical protein
VTDVSATIDALEIGSDEQALLARLGPLVRTPRAAKRLVNIYRIIRVAAQGADAYRLRPAPDGRDEYQAVVVLLGVLIGAPKAAPRFFELVRDADLGTTIWSLTEEGSPTLDLGAVPADPSPQQSTESDRLARTFEDVQSLKDGVKIARIEAYQRWLPVVERFSYQGSMHRGRDAERPESSDERSRLVTASTTSVAPD